MQTKAALEEKRRNCLARAPTVTLGTELLRASIR